jgi:EmrB/QacA subfamily drug resistance transporter
VLTTTILASSLAFIDGSVVNVGLPTIGKSLQASGPELAWVLDSYLLPLSALLLLGGAAGDQYGRRRLLIIGTGIFALASLLCAFAPNLSILITGRVLQGIGAALLMPNSLAILGSTFSGEARGRAIGIWAAAGAAGGALAPLLGGWLIDLTGWRPIFMINIPIAIGAMILARRYVPQVARVASSKIDLIGGMLVTTALIAITSALTRWSAGAHLSETSITALCLGALAMVFFVVNEFKRGDRAMLPLTLFRSQEFVGLTLLTLLLYGALGAVLVMIPFTLIGRHGYSATAAGAALLPLPIVIAATSSTMGGMAAKLGARWPLTAGSFIVAAGCALMTRIQESADYWTAVFPALLVISLGMAGAVAPLTSAVLASVPTEHNGVASGFNSAVARTGGLISTALLSGLLAKNGGAFRIAFNVASVACASACVVAALCAFALLKGGDLGPTDSRAQ